MVCPCNKKEIGLWIEFNTKCIPTTIYSNKFKAIFKARYIVKSTALITSGYYLLNIEFLVVKLQIILIL